MAYQRSEGPVRVKLPRGTELLGEITELLGASRFRVACKDGVERICRIPGKFRKRIRVSTGDWVIVRPWSIEDEKGDVTWIYTRTQANWLKKKGMI
ncbi:MAG: translation initiation factor 1A [Candidatus Aenigmatarchaeota archaeon]|nr:MAG: translation initiation factor 1A [Candidatus Aenigmarchaeota archaeon]